MRRWPSSFLNRVLVAWQLALAAVCVLGADVSTTSNDQFCYFALEIDGLDYDKMLTDTAILSAVRTNIAKAAATEVGKGVAVGDVETLLSKSISEDGSGVGSFLAEVSIFPPDGVRPLDIRDTLGNSSMLGDRVASGVESVSQGIGTKSTGGSKVQVKPFSVPRLRDRDQGLSFVVVVSMAAGMLTMLALLVYICIRGQTFSEVRTRLFGTTEEDSAARRTNMLLCCATKKDNKTANNFLGVAGWRGRRTRAS